jgi:hypothetical protein
MSVNRIAPHQQSPDQADPYLLPDDLEKPVLYRTLSICPTRPESDVDWNWVLSSKTKNAKTMYFRYMRCNFVGHYYQAPAISELNRCKRIYTRCLPCFRRFVRRTRIKRDTLTVLLRRKTLRRFIPHNDINGIVYQYLTRMHIRDDV